MQTTSTSKRDSHPTTAATVQLKDIRKTLPLRVLSKADWEHWTTKGYVIVSGAVPAANVERLAELLWKFDEKDPSDPSTWDAPQRREHKMKEIKGGLIPRARYKFEGRIAAKHRASEIEIQPGALFTSPLPNLSRTYALPASATAR